MVPGGRPEGKPSGRYPSHLDPNSSHPRPGWREAAVFVIVIATVTVFITLGAVKFLNQTPRSMALQDEEGIRLVGISQQLALAIVETGECREVKLIDTQNLVVQDATRGRGPAVASAVSPDGETLAIILGSPDDPDVTVVRVRGGQPVTLPASTLHEAGEQAGLSRFAVCDWSNLSWSSDSSRFLVFGCHRDESAVVIVETSVPPEAVALANTRAVQEMPRQAQWLNDHEILFSQMSDVTGKPVLMKISADDADALPIPVYGQ